MLRSADLVARASLRPLQNQLQLHCEAFVTSLCPTGLALGAKGDLVVSCPMTEQFIASPRRAAANNGSRAWASPPGIAFDSKAICCRRPQRQIFRSAPEREIFVFATLEPSVAAYHLAFTPAGLYCERADPPPATTGLIASRKTAKCMCSIAGLGRPQACV